MPVHRRIEVTVIGKVTVVRFVDRKILDAANIQELGDELFELAAQDQHRYMLLNFSQVEFLSSSALNKLIILEKKVKRQEGQLKLCCLRPEITEVFSITNLNRVFDIRETEVDAIKSF